LDDELFACIVKSDGISIVRNISHWPTTKTHIAAARFQIAAAKYGSAYMSKHSDALSRRACTALKKLYDSVWAPLETVLAGCTSVIVVPSEQLGTIQFSSLHDGERFLVERLSLAVAPSAQNARRGLERAAKRPVRALTLGESSYLAHAEAEAIFVGSLFPDAVVLVGPDANSSAFARESKDVDVIHIACHGHFRSDNPAFSALHFVDAPFTALDAQALRIRADIVMLSACESSVAENATGDEILGLVRGFLLAGASRVIASLWEIDDAVTKEFTNVFYIALQSGDRPVTALRKAQLQIKRDYPHPFYWAPFLLHGGW
jgi:CHAT domain-containing protein